MSVKKKTAPDLSLCQAAFEEFKSQHTTQKTLKQAIVGLLEDLAENKPVLLGLLMNHPKQEKLDGRRLVDVTVNSEKQMTMYFCTHNTPEVLSDTISWVACVKHSMRKESSTRRRTPGNDRVHRMYEEATEAFRSAVAPDIQRFRYTHTGSRRNPNVQVDHDFENGVRFDDMLSMFLDTKGLLRQHVRVRKATDGEDMVHWPHYTLVDTGLKESWVRYHENNACLRVIPAEDNAKGNTGFKIKKRKLAA